MINFSLSIDDENTQLNKFIAKVPVFRNMEWKFVYEQPQAVSMIKNSSINANTPMYKFPRNKPYISEKYSNR